jgi:hypothetical protein
MPEPYAPPTFAHSVKGLPSMIHRFLRHNAGKHTGYTSVAVPTFREHAHGCNASRRANPAYRRRAVAISNSCRGFTPSLPANCYSRTDTAGDRGGSCLGRLLWRTSNTLSITNPLRTVSTICVPGARKNDADKIASSKTPPAIPYTTHSQPPSYYAEYLDAV